MNSLVIYKQLVINSIALPMDLINEVKNYLFYDKLSAESRNKKRGLINQLKLGLWYMPDFTQGHWGLSYRYEVQLQAINCPSCGQFVYAGYIALIPSTACNCGQNHFGEDQDDDDYELQIYD
jgi:hypothetical protein